MQLKNWGYKCNAEQKLMTQIKICSADVIIQLENDNEPFDFSYQLKEK